MNTFNHLARPIKYALLCAIAAGLLGTFIVNLVSEMLTWIFVPSVVIMVFVCAYFAFRRQMRGKGRLDSRRIFLLSLEVGTLSHLYTFMLYIPLNFFFETQGEFRPELIFFYILGTILMSLVSIISYVWFAVPMYLGIGYLIKSMEESMSFDENDLDAPSLDTGITNDRVYRNNDLDF
jgi:hypothetical protein